MSNKYKEDTNIKRALSFFSVSKIYGVTQNQILKLKIKKIFSK